MLASERSGVVKTFRCVAMTTRKQFIHFLAVCYLKDIIIELHNVEVDQLTPADFGASPVWEFAPDEEGLDGQDECTVRPSGQHGPVDVNTGMFLVRATFTLADGSSAVGYVSPPYDFDDDLGVIQPVIVTEAGQIMFWWGILKPTRDWIDSAYRMLGRDASNVFPIRFLSDLDSTDGPISGKHFYRGFCAVYARSVLGQLKKKTVYTDEQVSFRSQNPNPLTLLRNIKNGNGC